MKIISWNVNGLRAVYKRGFLDWLLALDADIVCLQEIKAFKEQLDPSLLNVKNYFAYFNSAQKSGYSGLLVYTKEKPLAVGKKLGLERFDKEGRSLLLEYKDLLLLNVYLPHGDRTKKNLPYKLEVYDFLLKKLRRWKDKNLVLIGDFNIAHEEIDLARPKNNKKNVMFTPEEREKIDKIIELGFTDTFRKFHQEEGQYTWWPYFANARERNLGWRIDYIFVSKRMNKKVKDAFILSQVKGSDHCPIGLEI